jgi:hypothetical protein
MLKLLSQKREKEGFTGFGSISPSAHNFPLGHRQGLELNVRKESRPTSRDHSRAFSQWANHQESDCGLHSVAELGGM